MKYLLLPFVCALNFSFSMAQVTYEIKSLGSDYSTTEIESALEAANLCGFYYVSERRELIFDDGAVVELLGSDELSGMDSSCFIQPNSVNDSNVWEIAPSGYLIRRIQTQPTK